MPLAMTVFVAFWPGVVLVILVFTWLVYVLKLIFTACLSSDLFLLVNVL